MANTRGYLNRKFPKENGELPGEKGKLPEEKESSSRKGDAFSFSPIPEDITILCPIQHGNATLRQLLYRITMRPINDPRMEGIRKSRTPGRRLCLVAR